MDQIMTGAAPFTTPLKRIHHPKGDIYHALKASDAGFAGFGEAYFTTVHHGQAKGWKKHTRMQMNLVVVVGAVHFHVYDERSKETTRFVVGEDNYVRLTVPPGFWVAFEGMGSALNLVCNIASIAHDPEEALNLPLESFAMAGRGA